MRIVAVIPARMASTRFPGKPMAMIHGLPMIGHCLLRVQLCSLIDETYVATCDHEIFDFVEGIGGSAVMTDRSHERASDRAAEAMLLIEKRSGLKTDILVMVQGDEPLDTPTMIVSAISPMIENEEINVVNLMGRIETIEEFDDPNTVKVVTDQDGNAVYFSREPIPSRRKGGPTVPMKKQICVIPFRRDFLLKFNKLPETPLEIIESVDMLRVLESGYSVKMVWTDEPSIGVDTPEDLEVVKKLMGIDPLFSSYK